MNIPLTRRLAVPSLIVCLCTCADVSAQTRGSGGDLVLFGGADPQLNTRARWFDTTVSISSAYDDDLTGDQGVTPASGQSRVGGRYSILDGSFSFAQKRRRFTLVARGASALQRYPGLDSFLGSNDSGSAVLTANVGRKTLIRTSLDASHVSSFSVDAFARPTAQDQAVDAGAADGLPTSGFQTTSVDWTMNSYGGTGELVRTVSRHTSIGFIGGLRHSERRILDQRGDEQIAGVQMWRTTGRMSSVRLSYIYQQGSQDVSGDTRQLWSHDVQLGIERRWVHSATRYTTLSLSGGPSAERQALDTLAASQNDEPTHLFRVVGAVSLNHMMSDRWTARLSYRRGTGVATSMVFSNTGALDIHGSLTRRVDLQGSVGYSDGDLAVGTLRNRYGTAYATTRVQVALARSVALYAQSFFYRYDFGATATGLSGSPAQLERRGVRIGLNLWMPVKRG